MKIGQKIEWIRDELPPLQSPNTDLISAWLTCGGTLLPVGGYSDAVEEVDGQPKRTVTWNVDGCVSVNFGTEEVDFAEFRRRWISEDWIRANTDHPITYLKQFRDNMKKVKGWLKDQKPSVLVRRGGRTAVIPANCPEAKKQKILAALYE